MVLANQITVDSRKVKTASSNLYGNRNVELMQECSPQNLCMATVSNSKLIGLADRTKKPRKKTSGQKLIWKEVGRNLKKNCYSSGLPTPGVATPERVNDSPDLPKTPSPHIVDQGPSQWALLLLLLKIIFDRRIFDLKDNLVSRKT